MNFIVVTPPFQRGKGGLAFLQMLLKGGSWAGFNFLREFLPRGEGGGG